MASRSGVLEHGLIGRGAFGEVHLVENGGEKFAVKKVDLTRESSLTPTEAQNEGEVLKLLCHEHVVVYNGCYITDDAFYLVTEYCQGGDLGFFLNNLIKMGQFLPEDLLLCWLTQIACALEYMHTGKPAILHRDLKPSNIYLTDTGTIRIGDMGIAKILASPSVLAGTFCGTAYYMCPEIMNERPYGTKADIWSLGCCVVEMATLERSFSGSSLAILLRAIKKQRTPLPSRYSRELDMLVAQMLQMDPDQRLSAAGILDNQLIQISILNSLHATNAAQELLKKHNLMDAILRKPELLKTRGTVDKSVYSSMNSNMSDYVDRKKKRKIGRRYDVNGVTLVSTISESMKTALRGTQDKTIKSKKKDICISTTSTASDETFLCRTLETLGATSSPPETVIDSATLRDVDVTLTVSSMMSTFLSTLITSNSEKKAQHLNTITKASPETQVAAFEKVLTSILGPRAQTISQTVTAISRADSSSADMSNFTTAFSDGSATHNALVFLVLLKSMKQSKGSQ